VLATNLAIQRAKAGEKVCLVDCDGGLANAHLLLGIAPRHDIGDLIQNRVKVEEALEKGPEGVQIISGGVGRPALANPTRKELDRLFRALRPLEDSFDLLIIDHGAGLSYSTITHLAATSTLLLVTNPEVTALSDAYALYKQACTSNSELRAGLVVNRAIDEAAAWGAWERFEGVSRRFLQHAPDFVGWVPQDEAIYHSVQRRSPVCLDSPGAESARALARIALWGPLDHARTARPFYDRARKALR
jgi:flagellar biosynthesis protein FlhG